MVIGVNGDSESERLQQQQQQPQPQPQPQPQSQSQTQTTTATTGHVYLLGNTLPRHQTPLTWRDRLETAFSLGNGIGTITLILAIVFGIGAWAGMNIQISQGGKSIELTIWATCADHEVSHLYSTTQLEFQKLIYFGVSSLFNNHKYARAYYPKISTTYRKEITDLVEIWLLSLGGTSLASLVMLKW